MRMLVLMMMVAAVSVTACEKKPKTVGEKVGAAAEKAGDDIKDATN